MGPKRKAVKRSNAKAKSSPKPKQKKASAKPKDKKRSKSQERKKRSKSQEKRKRSKSQEKKKRVQKSNKIAKQHKQKLLNAKKERQRHRNAQMMRMRRRIEGKTKHTEKEQKAKEGETTKDGEVLDEDETILINQYMKEDSFFMRLKMRLEDCLAGLLFFLTVTLRSERTFDWLAFLANNLGLYQEYEINDYGQRLSPRTGRPVLLSLGPVRVVQIVESANQVRSYWDPYIRDYLRNSNLTTDCWRANRMALQVALCMDDAGTMYDMPLNNEGDGEPEV